jgi:plastocyanin
MKRFIMMMLVLFSGCTGGTQEPAKEVTAPTAQAEETEAPQTQAPDMVVVELKNIQFSPREVTVAKGGTVVWVNRDLATHTVTSYDYTFDVTIKRGEETQRTFEGEGVYEYYCTIHSGMEGKVIVK